MNNNYFNPDYPTNVGYFTQHTYENTNPSEQSYYYNGGAVNPFAQSSQFNQQTAQPDSRRNVGLPNNTQTVNNGYPQNNTQQAVPETQIQPFSSYPSGTPNNGNGQVPFNSLIDSRRNVGLPNNTQQVTQNNVQNPWIAQPAGSTTTYPYNYNIPVNSYGYPGVEIATSALYDDPNKFGFDRKQGCWENMYTTPRVPTAPDINWNAQSQQNLNPIGYQQNIVQYPRTNESWADIAKNIWK